MPSKPLGKSVVSEATSFVRRPLPDCAVCSLLLKFDNVVFNLPASLDLDDVKGSVCLLAALLNQLSERIQRGAQLCVFVGFPHQLIAAILFQEPSSLPLPIDGNCRTHDFPNGPYRPQ